MTQKDKKNRSEVHTFRSKEQIESQKLAFSTAEQLELILNDPTTPYSSRDRKSIRYSQNVLISALLTGLCKRLFFLLVLVKGW